MSSMTARAVDQRPLLLLRLVQLDLVLTKGFSGGVVEVVGCPRWGLVAQAVLASQEPALCHPLQPDQQQRFQVSALSVH
jgi:hypothetical protein